MTNNLNRSLAAGFCAILLLAFIASRQLVSSDRPIGFGIEGDADRYHSQVKRAVEHGHHDIPGWTRTNRTIHRAAENLRQPNVVWTKSYISDETGSRADILLFQSRDVRDMAGYHPPNYYPAAHKDHHVELVWSNLRKWKLRGQTITGIRYQFNWTEEYEPVRRIVDYFLILPNGKTTNNLDYVIGLQEDKRMKLFGAAQMHIVTDADLTPDQRDALFVEIVKAYSNALDRMRSGVDR